MKLLIVCCAQPHLPQGRRWDEGEKKCSVIVQTHGSDIECITVTACSPSHCVFLLDCFSGTFVMIPFIFGTLMTLLNKVAGIQDSCRWWDMTQQWRAGQIGVGGQWQTSREESHTEQWCQWSVGFMYQVNRVPVFFFWSDILFQFLFLSLAVEQSSSPSSSHFPVSVYLFIWFLSHLPGAASTYQHPFFFYLTIIPLCLPAHTFTFVSSFFSDFSTAASIIIIFHFSH